ncbi:hypothetical protein ACHAXN_010853 [Cyclotella atomus]
MAIPEAMSEKVEIDQSSTSASDVMMNHEETLQQAIHLYQNDKILSATRLLQSIPSANYESIHHHIIKEGLIFQKLLDQSNDHHTSRTSAKEDEWFKQGEQHGRYNFCIYYKLSKENHLTCRIESPIHSDLLVPLLSVLVVSRNQHINACSWLGCMKMMLNLLQLTELRQIGRCGQILLVETEVQWPLGSRQLLLKAVACDDIDTHIDVRDGDKPKIEGQTHGGKVLVRIESLCDQADKEELEGLEVPPTKKGYVRMEVQGGFVFEKCPLDHPMRESAGSQDDLVLVTFSFSVDPKLRIPQTLINFFVRTAIGHLWGMFLRVAEEVKDGKRPAHSKAIDKKREMLYNWVDERAAVMLES